MMMLSRGGRTPGVENPDRLIYRLNPLVMRGQENDYEVEICCVQCCEVYCVDLYVLLINLNLQFFWFTSSKVSEWALDVVI